MTTIGIHKSEIALNLENSISKIRQYLPSSAIESFNPSNVTFSVLNLIFDQIAYTFYNAENSTHVLSRYSKHLQSGMIMPRPLPSQKVDDAAVACDELICAIFPSIAEMNQKNLIIFWKALLIQYPCPFFACDDAINDDTIHSFLEDKEKSKSWIASIKFIDLKGVPIDFLPSEINLFTNLQTVLLFETHLREYPHALDSHPNSASLIVDGNYLFI